MTKVLTVTALLSFSQMIIIALGGMDLSVGTTGALCSIFAGGAMQVMGASPVVAFLVGIICGILCGLLNSLLIFRSGGIGIAFFLVTLATSSIFQGITFSITEGIPFYKIDPAFLAIGDTNVAGLPISFFIMLLIAVLLGVFFYKLKLGRQILAYGANYKASLLYGVSKFQVVLFSCLIAGLIAGFAGLMGLIRVQTAQPNMGADWMLMSFAATYIGGTSPSGGRVSIVGTIIGAFALTIIDNALVYLMVDTYWNQLIYGLVILIAVSIKLLRKLRK
jgi:ribose transport system permease protein